MIQKQLTTAGMQIATCGNCKRLPRLYLCVGRTNHEPPKQQGDMPIRYMLECACGKKTPRFNSSDLAIRDWGELWAQRALPLKKCARRTRRAAA